MDQLHYTKAPKDSKYLGKSIMAKVENNGTIAIMTVIKNDAGKQHWNGINLTKTEAEKVVNFLQQQISK